MPMDHKVASVVFIGFGEAARAIAEGWGVEQPQPRRVYDIKLADPLLQSEMQAAAQRAAATPVDSPEDAWTGTGAAVFCLVTADQAASAAEAAARHLPPGTLWLDGNSCAPGTKRQAAAAIEAAGGRYVDLAIMAPIRPKLHRTPMLLAGPHAEAAHDLLAGFGMDVRIAGPAVGDASAIKMIRSVMIKGLEALTAECLLAARQAGVEEQVLASFEASDPAIDWRRRSLYNLGRMSEHGLRRAAEMREVARTLRELDLPDRLAAATAEWQEQIGQLQLSESAPDLGAALDQALKALRR